MGQGIRDGADPPSAPRDRGLNPRHFCDADLCYIVTAQVDHKSPIVHMFPPV